MDAEGIGARTALVVGQGGLGQPAALALAAAGIGALRLADPDLVESTDLTHHPILGEGDLGRPKVEAVAAALEARFPAVRTEPLQVRLEPGSVAGLLAGVDLLVDASDNFATRFLASDAAVAAGIPLVHGALQGFTAHLLTIVPGATGCLRCLFEAPPAPEAVPDRPGAGAVGPLAALVGALMGQEAVRLVSGLQGHLAGRLLVYEARGASSRTIPLRPRPGCPACARLPGGATRSAALREVTP